MKLIYKHNQAILASFYKRFGLSNAFKVDNLYLQNAFFEINEIWQSNFESIEQVRYLMIGEAPLWGEQKKYVYNPETNNTQFFYRSDLETVLNVKIEDKKAFIKTCNEIGLLMVDISPFPLNTKDTKINYGKDENGSRKLTKKEYQDLVRQTLESFFNPKMQMVGQKKHPEIKVFFRYARVKQAFQDIIADVLIQNNLIETTDDIGDIAQSGGGIDRKKLGHIIKPL